MQISLNGEKVESERQTLMELILGTGLDPASVVAEVNLKVIRQNSWTKITINEGDDIELLSFVGGG
ncbi:sulfur carrier protein ThiS [Desulfotignum phosphitoxidans]|uniref:Thiamine biosynthesis protein ThiS n=1 Tax=Desulfotignum phosphitoxidans DSM 13687 TaxID=1286635 RepID=S0G668_9BACT|nr:sulfur carrier protein ThiS [Desulfotignum phosphitoxidans]EMS81494.1 thiamine biosynthesis protein ThiS [Desulfotignum phosphitoxidans DSM 13687]